MMIAKRIVWDLQREINQALSSASNMAFELVSRLQQWERELQVIGTSCCFNPISTDRTCWFTITVTGNFVVKIQGVSKVSIHFKI